MTKPYELTIVHTEARSSADNGPFDVERIGRLRQVAEEELRAIDDGPILEQIARVVCDGCGFVLHLSLERFGLDWPEQLEGWGTRAGVGDLCPTCMDRERGDESD